MSSPLDPMDGPSNRMPATWGAAAAHGQFSMALSEDAGHLLFAVAGEIDLASAPQFRESLHAAIDQASQHEFVDKVIVDLDAVEFMDSTGLNALIRALRHAQQRHTELLLRSPGPHLRRLFEITGLDRLFGIDDAPVRDGRGH